MLLAWQILVFNDEKKKSGLTRNIWYSTGGEAFVRGSWQRNKRRQKRGTCGDLGGWGLFLKAHLFSIRALKAGEAKEKPLDRKIHEATHEKTHTHIIIIHEEAME